MAVCEVRIDIGDTNLIQISAGKTPDRHPPPSLIFAMEIH
jgi:hypothetical protein